jgi:multicopper oxidase
VTETPRSGTTEIWEIYDFTEDAHPFHVHLVQFEIILTYPLRLRGQARRSVPSPFLSHWRADYHFPTLVRLLRVETHSYSVAAGPVAVWGRIAVRDSLEPKERRQKLGIGPRMAGSKKEQKNSTRAQSSGSTQREECKQ